MNLSSMKEIKIGNIPLMELYIGGMLVWKKLAYNNLVPFATTEPGGSEVYNGVGYKDETRWSASGGSVVMGTKARLSGWIPYTIGSVYRVKGFGVIASTGYVDGVYVVYYKNDGSIITKATGKTTSSKYTIDTENDLVTFTATETDVAYFRISGFCTAPKADGGGSYGDPIVTIDEEII